MAKCGKTITITSVTDIFAFGISGTSSLPILSNFCIYAAAGIFFVYLYMITFFLAWFSLDQRRINDKRDACVICIKAKDCRKDTDDYDLSLMERLFAAYADILATSKVKCAILIASMTVLLVSSYGASQLKAEYDDLAYVSNTSYLIQYHEADQYYFPKTGSKGIVYLIDVPNIGMKLDKMKQLISNVENLNEVDSVNAFLPYFEAYVKIVNKIH